MRNRVTAHHLHEIVFVDNDSGFNDLKGELDEYVQKYLSGNIKVNRNVLGVDWRKNDWSSPWSRSSGVPGQSLLGECNTAAALAGGHPGGSAEHGSPCK